jgi:hypothetical protein
VQWVVETAGLTLFRSVAGAFLCVPYPYAAVWDLIQRGYQRNDAVRLTGHIAGVPTGEARRLVDQAIRDWKAMGLLVSEAEHG